eukprot:scaffold7349_cov173-Amphora_coffeaeformis.AAC.114
MWPCSIQKLALSLSVVSSTWICICHGWSSILTKLGPRRIPGLYDTSIRARSYDYYDDVEPSLENRYYDDEPYWEYSSKITDQDIYANGESDYLADDKLDWETCSTDAGTAHILLPPPSVDRPTIVLHFVGGTFFGSSPSIWYRRILEEIVQNTQAAVIATSIPVTLWQSPLQHVRLSRQIERQFQTAWREVLLDEYGEELTKVPVCGLGHSLGSRLLTVLATLSEADPATTEKRPKWKPPNYSSYILVSFTNYGAGAGIPGIYQLNRASRRLEREAQEEKQRKKTRRRDDFYDDDFDDEDWSEILDDLQTIFQEQAGKVRRVLTPDSKELEFFPSPEQLWKALTFDRRYKIPETLAVQFDDDEIDQSAKLVTVLKGDSNFRFARLRGTHLTPVAIGDTSKEKKAWYDINSRAGKTLAKIILGKRRKESNEQASRELRQTITSYITEVASRAGRTTV